MNRTLILLMVATSAVAQLKNVSLVERNEGDTSPMQIGVVINPKNPKNIVVTSAKKISYSLDGGIQWVKSSAASSLGSSGTESLIADPKGNLYLIHPTGDSAPDKPNGIVFQKSSDEGISWSEGELLFEGQAGVTSALWASGHPKKETMLITWTSRQNPDAPCDESLMLATSASAGKKWGKPVVVNQTPGDCSKLERPIQNGMGAISYDGKLFVIWVNGGGIYLDRSYDGKMWLHTDLEIASQENDWFLDIPGVGLCNGAPILAFDNSPTRTHGSLNLVYADQSVGAEDTDIWLMRSVNNGDNWTQPIRINKDEQGKHQFMPRLAVDQTTGYIYVVYYDRREYEDAQTDVYLAWSVDGGNDFKEKKISESPFIPSMTMGLSENALTITAHKGVIVPVWTRLDGDKPSVIGAVIKHEDLIK